MKTSKKTWKSFLLEFRTGHAQSKPRQFLITTSNTIMLNGHIRNRIPENGRLQNGGVHRMEQVREDVLEEAIREKLAELREQVVEEMKLQLDPDKIISRLSKTRTGKDSGQLLEKDKLKSIVQQDNGRISRRIFTSRESELTDLLKLKHISTIYNVFVSSLICLFFSTIVHDVINTGKLNVGFSLLSWGFTGFHFSILIWLEMMAFLCFLYLAYSVWAMYRQPLGLTSRSMISLFIVFAAIHTVIPCYQVRLLKLPIASSMAVLMEQVRLLMKAYAFVRTNVPRTLEHESSDTEPFFVPSFEKFLYYLFAPTLIYRDEYPRTSKIRWSFAVARFAEVFAVTLFLAFLGERYIIPTTKDFGKEKVPFRQIFAMAIDNALPAITGGVCIFYGLLHAWLNGCAEILRFGDRMFYQDWWNTTGYAEYYKTWNIVVYDWLYTFIYRDAKIINNRAARAVLVIAVSAIFHDYLLTAAVGFCLPAFFVIYGIGGSAMLPVYSNNKTIGNIFIWFTLSLGSGIMITVYLAEYYARINCPRTIESDFWDFVTPRMALCYM